jgi:hypothetical protein
MSTQPFVLTNFGYFGYLVRSNACHHIVVPKIELVPHLALLCVSRAATTIEGALSIQTLDEKYLAIGIDGLSISINSEAPATLGRRSSGSSMDVPDFDWVPDFTQTCCGVALDPNWRQSPAVGAVITLGGGELRAEPDGHTCQDVWTWNLCDGTTHSQRVSTLTTYAIGLVENVVLTCRSVSSSVKVAQVTMAFDDTAPPFVIHVPAVSPNGNRADASMINYSHIQVMLRICVPSGGEIRVPAKRKDPTPCASGISAKDASAAFGPMTRFVILHDGTPECSGQQLALP